MARRGQSGRLPRPGLAAVADGRGSIRVRPVWPGSAGEAVRGGACAAYPDGAMGRLVFE